MRCVFIHLQYTCSFVGQLGHALVITPTCAQTLLLLCFFFELAGLFASSLRNEANDAGTIISRGTAQVQYRESSPRSTGIMYEVSLFGVQSKPLTLYQT